MDRPPLRGIVRGFGAGALGLWLASSDLWAQGCSMCREATGGPGDPLARALHWSTLFLVATPLLLVGSFAGWLWLAWRRAGGRAPIDPALSTAPPSTTRNFGDQHE